MIEWGRRSRFLTSACGGDSCEVTYRTCDRRQDSARPALPSQATFVPEPKFYGGPAPGRRDRCRRTPEQLRAQNKNFGPRNLKGARRQTLAKDEVSERRGGDGDLVRPPGPRDSEPALDDGALEPAAAHRTSTPTEDRWSKQENCRNTETNSRRRDRSRRLPKISQTRKFGSVRDARGFDGG